MIEMNKNPIWPAVYLQRVVYDLHPLVQGHYNALRNWLEPFYSLVVERI